MYRAFISLSHFQDSPFAHVKFNLIYMKNVIMKLTAPTPKKEEERDGWGVGQFGLGLWER